MDVYRVISGLIENATSENLNAPDINAMKEVSDVVRSRADMPKEAVKQIHNRLMKKDKKVTMLCLELLEYLSYTCEMTLYNQIATKEFMMRIGALLKSHDSDELVKKRICCLVKCWKEIFYKDIQVLFFQFYDNVVQKGFQIPSNYQSPYAHLKGSSGSSSSKPASQSQSFGSSSSSQPQSSYNKPSSSSSNQNLSGAKQKLKNDLENIKQNITLVNEMIDNQDPRGNVDQNGALSDLIQVLKTSEKNMQNLIEQLAAENDEGLLELSLQLNDDIQSTFDRHSALKRHQKPKPFRGKAVEEEVMQQISQLEVSGKQQNSASIFSDTANALSQGLAKAQGTKVLAPPQNFQQPSQAQQPKPAQTNILDLFDDDEPPISIPQKPVQQQNQPPQNNNLFDMMDGPSQSTQPTQQNVNQTPVNNMGGQTPNNFSTGASNNMGGTSLQQLYNQAGQQNNQMGQNPNQMGQNPNANKYQAFSAIGQQNQMGGMNMGYNAMNQPMGGQYPQQGGYPNQQAGYGQQGYGMNNPNPQMGGGYGMGMNNNMGMGMNNNMGMGMQGNMGMGMNQQQGYGGGMNTGGYGGNNFNNPSQSGGYGGGLPSSSLPQTGNKGYGSGMNDKKDAFDDLDDMIGISTNSSNKPPQQMQTTASKAADFDLF